MMSPARYIAIESAVSAVINAVLSIAFTLAVFGRVAQVPAGDLIFDAVPQTFMVALMATLVPTLLTRKRLKQGRAPTMARFPVALPRSAPVRALLAAVVLALLAWVAHRMLLPINASFAFSSVVIAKALYGALLGLIVTALAVRIALGEE
ncbi:hypothetical protein ACFSC3_01095 [Sphingomonas floccifaciens]|uniref:TRAP transporter small permease subunit n=1 Tax=Sphingomonas floccifaciens TaxID=1844115 RepID=A0ABW4N8X3_9SPHN